MIKPSRKTRFIYLLLIIPILLFGIWFFFFNTQPVRKVELSKVGPAFLSESYEPWADSILQTLSVKDKIAQLVMIETDGLMENISVVEKKFSRYNYGGVFYRGTNLISHISIYNTLNENLDVAPFFAVKAPFGLYEVSDSSYAPPVFATFNNFESDSVLEYMARYVAGQCKALNIHFNFSSSLDIIEQNEDPAYDPGYHLFAEKLIRKSLIYTKALADSGIMAVHGSFLNLSSNSNSIEDIPVFERYEKRWDTLRIRPYRILSDSGVQALWVNHFPRFNDESEKNQYLLQKPEIKDSLIKHTGFKGLVFGDIRQTEIASIYSKRDAAFYSVLSGSDMIIVNDSAEQIVDYLASMVGKKGFSTDLLNQKVKKILMAKAWAGIPFQKNVDWVKLAKNFNRKNDFVFSQKLYESSMVLLQDRNKMIPLNNLDKRTIGLISIGKRKHYTFNEQINKYFPVNSYLLEQNKDPKLYERLTKELSVYNTLIVGVDVNYINPRDTFFMNYLLKLNNGRQMALVLYGDHNALDYFIDFPTLILTYGHSKMAENVAAHLVMGGMESSGKLPVTCSGKFCYADGLSRKKTRVRFTFPEYLGISSDSLDRIDYLAENSIKGQAAPGMQVLVIKDGNVIFQRAYGHHTYDREMPVLNTDIYDLASVTKVAATTIACMMLYDQGRLKLDTVLSAYLPGLDRSELKNVKIRDILLHRAGFPAVPPVFKYIRAVQKFKKYKGKGGPIVNIQSPQDSLMGQLMPKDENDTLYRYAYSETEDELYTLPVGEEIFLREDMLDSIYKLVTKTKLISPIEYKYSDMSMYIMMQVIQHITGKSLDEYLELGIYRSMGLYTMGFNPLKKFDKNVIIPTEQDDLFRKQLIHGYVHDPTASILGGVSGHAGLFSNALDLATLMQMVLNGGSYGGRTYFSAETVKLFTSTQPGSHRGLGWDHQYPSGNPMCADSSSVYTYGHTGFTGTCVWVDPQHQLIYVFLSNRVYPTAENKKLQTTAIRQRIHQVIYDAILN